MSEFGILRVGSVEIEAKDREIGEGEGEGDKGYDVL